MSYGLLQFLSFFILLMIFGRLLRATLEKLLSVRLFINNLSNKVGARRNRELSKREYALYWVPVLLVFLAPFPFEFFGIARNITDTFRIGALLIPLVFSVYWVIINKCSTSSFIAVFASIVSMPAVFITQCLIMALNLLMIVSTSVRYEGRIKYISITPK